MDDHESKGKKSLRRPLLIGGVIAAVVVIVIIVAVAALTGGTGRTLKKQLDLGQRYLSEMNYEQALAAFEAAIEIDPMSVEAYLGAADAYVGMEDFESAKALLEKGIERLSAAGGHEADIARLKKKVDEIQAMIDAANPISNEPEPQIEEEAERVDIASLSKDVNRIVNIFSGTATPFFYAGSGYMGVLTVDERKAACEPFIQTLEDFVYYYDTGNPGATELFIADLYVGEVYRCLANIYLLLGDESMCLDARTRGFKITEWPVLNPQGREEEDYAENIYGQTVLFGGYKVEYDEKHRTIYETSIEGDYEHYYEYDEQNRVHVHRTVSHMLDGLTREMIYTYDYVGDGLIEERYTCAGTDTVWAAQIGATAHENYIIYEYDEYGRKLRETIYQGGELWCIYAYPFDENEKSLGLYPEFEHE